MKQKKSFLLLLILLAFPYYMQADTITVADAIKNKCIVFSATRNATENNADVTSPTHMGKCIKVHLQNVSGKNLKILIEAGRFMMPDDSTLQRMMVTQQELITLYKSQTITKELYAMCSEMHDAAPRSETSFTVGAKATGNLLALAKYISDNNYQSMAAQSAVWCLTDNNEPSDIFSDNSVQMKNLRDFVFKTTGKKVSSPGQYLKYEKGKISGQLEFELKQDKIMTMNLYDESGKLIRSSFKNFNYQSGINTITYEYEYFNIPAGNYYLKLEDPKGEVFLSKMLTFKYE